MLVQYKLEQLERLRSEDTPRRLMITHTIESYWIPNFWILKRALHATHLLKLLDKMCKYEMDPMSIVEDTERTRFCPQTDKIIPVYFQLRWSGGYNDVPEKHIGTEPFWRCRNRNIPVKQGQHIAADALAPTVARPSAAMVLNMQNNYALLPDRKIPQFCTKPLTYGKLNESQDFNYLLYLNTCCISEITVNANIFS